MNNSESHTSSNDAINSQLSSNDQKAWKLIEKTLMHSIIEQRRARRWNIFFRLIFLFIFISFFITTSHIGSAIQEISNKSSSYQINDLEQAPTTKSNNQYVGIIKLEGMIANDENASAENLNKSLIRAFSDPGVSAVILEINSGGGSPVQSGDVYDEIKRLRALYPEKKIYAVITDIGASGAYYIASAADEIYANKASLVGSIGVTAASFGFTQAMEKLGIERRLYTAGDHKAFLDPFSPMNAEETDFWENTLNTIHQQFINAVVEGRGDRLKVDEYPNLFSGLIWDGESALKIGLIDQFGSSAYVAREVIGIKKLKDFSYTQDPFERFVKQIGANVTTEVFNTLSSPNLN